jgi:O-antigen/teichoic acid export membrane protein
LAFTASLKVALIAYFIGLLIKMIPSAYIISRNISTKFTLDWLIQSKKLFKYGAESFIFSLTVILVFRVDAFIINNLVGLEKLGQYAIAITFAEMVLMLPSSIGSALFARFPTIDTATQIELLKKTSRGVVAITSVICIVLGIISPFIVTTLMGAKYSDAVAPLCVLLPGLVAMATAYIFANYFAGTGYPIYGAGVFGVGLISKIGLSYVLVPSLGIIGAALASSVAYIVIALSFYILLLRKSPSITIRSLFIPTYEDFRMFALRIKTSLRR